MLGHTLSALSDFGFEPENADHADVSWAVAAFSRRPHPRVTFKHVASRVKARVFYSAADAFTVILQTSDKCEYFGKSLYTPEFSVDDVHETRKLFDAAVALAIRDQVAIDGESRGEHAYQ